MTTNRLNRSAVIARLKAGLRDRAPSTVAVARGVARDEDTDRLIAIGDITGNDTGVPTMRAGRKHYDDTYEVELICIAWDAGADDFDRCDEWAEELGELVRDYLAEHAQLNDEGGDGLAGVSSAYVSSADGPNPFRTEAGVASAMRVVVTVTARIT